MINKESFYTPSEISEMDLFLTKTKATKKQMILRLIRLGKIPAKNLGAENQKRYLVLGKDLIEFINQKKHGK